MLLLAALAISIVQVGIAADQTSATGDNDLLLGHWTLIVAKSKYNPGPAPKSQKRTYEVTPQGLKTTVTTIHADGHSTSVDYVTNSDGIEYPVSGSSDVDAIALKRLSTRTAEATLMHAGKLIGTARRVISGDGKTMTISFRDAKGVISNVAVYQKDEK